MLSMLDMRSPAGLFRRRRGFARTTTLAACVAAVVGLLALTPGTFAQSSREVERRTTVPRPRPVPVQWEFDFRPGPLRVGWVEVEGVPQLYYYFTYRVTNNTGSDRSLAPSFELATDAGEILRPGASSGVPLRVIEELKARLRNPFLQDQVGLVGTLRQGPENAREGIIVWPVTNTASDEVRIFAAGFSGEYAEYRVRDRETGDYENVQLRKTMMLTYRTPGTLTAYNDRSIEPVSRTWEMR